MGQVSLCREVIIQPVVAMREPERKFRPLFRLESPTSQKEDPELDLLLELDRIQPGDLGPVDALAALHGIEMYRLVSALMDHPHKPVPMETFLELYSRSIKIILADPRSHRSEDSLRDWLFKILIRNWRSYRRLEVWKLSSLRGKAASRQSTQRPVDRNSKPATQSDQEQRAWKVLDPLDDGSRLVTVLHFIWDLNVQTISRLSGFSPQHVQQRLNAVRGGIYANQLRAEHEWSSPQPGHHTFQTMMLTSLDGWDRLSAQEQYRLQSHLETCPVCLKYSQDFDPLEAQMHQWCLNRWGKLDLDPAIASQLAQQVRERIRKTSARSSPPHIIRQAAQMVLILALVVGADWFIRTVSGTSRSGVDVPAIPSNEATYDLPAVAMGLPGVRPSRSGFNAGLYVNRFDFRLEPALSGDGHWLAYSWSLAQPPRSQSQPSETVKSQTGLVLYDLDEDRSMQLLPAQLGSFEIGGWPGGSGDADAVLGITGGRITSPGLSEDGRWLVFAINPSEEMISGGMQTCTSKDNTCGQILLYDREEGSLELVSRGIGGAFPDGIVLQPSITADGSSIFYWSNAANLVMGDTEICSTGGKSPYNCWDLFIYNREQQRTQRIAVGRRIEQLMWNDPIGLSADGRFVALTIHRRDRIAQQVSMNTIETGVYVFDRENDNLVPANRRADGSPGDGLSLLPVLSADGRYVAFSTTSGNLDVRDTNNLFDVYLKDLRSGRIERISQATGGGSGNSSSGLISMVDLITDKFSHLGLSSDGRYGIYLSTASNMSTVGPAWCAIYGYGRCGNLYVHDRKTGETIPVFTEPQKAGSYISPRVSPEGRWVVAVYQYESCSEPYGCAQIGIFDRENPEKWKMLVIDQSGSLEGSQEH